MTRPYARSRVDELQAILEKDGVSEAELEALEEELGYRSTPSARELLAKVGRKLRLREGIARARVKMAERAAQGTAPVVPVQVSLGFSMPLPAGQPVPVADAPSGPDVPTSRGVPVAAPITRVSEGTAHMGQRTAAVPDSQGLGPDTGETASEDIGHEISLEQAYRILNVSANAGWETIERARRGLVARASPDLLARLPDDQRSALRGQTRLVNAAYKRLARDRN